jgi:hypothetical protein
LNNHGEDTYITDVAPRKYFPTNLLYLIYSKELKSRFQHINSKIAFKTVLRQICMLSKSVILRMILHGVDRKI